MTHVVTVAVLTYRRNEMLAALLPVLLDHLRSSRPDLATPVTWEVVVVDNDPDRGAEETVRSFAAADPVRYAAEATPGIAAARNRALDEAAGSRLLVFIDDDELPLPGWFAGLLETWERHQCAGVAGPVRATLDEARVDPWILEGGYFERDFHRRFTTGQPVPVAPTGNLLLEVPRVHARGVRFDATLGLAGGEDTLFTRQLIARGERIVWCAEAVVLDDVPVDRLTRRWVLTRTFHVANASTRISLRLAPTPAARSVVRARYASTGSVRFLLGSLVVLLGGLLRRRRWTAVGAQRVARGAGVVAAVSGISSEEYRR